MKKEILMGIAAFSMLLVSCGGESADGDGTDTTAQDTVPAVVVTDYTIDTAATIINWKSYAKIGDTSKYHLGTVNALSGTATVTDTDGATTLTAGTIVIDMNSVQEGAGMADLDAHLKEPEFFDVNKFASSTFTFEGFENGTITGSLSIIGQTVAISAPAEVIITADNVTVNVSTFTIDMLALNVPFFVEESKGKPEKQHDPKIEISATVVANK